MTIQLQLVIKDDDDDDNNNNNNNNNNVLIQKLVSCSNGSKWDSQRGGGVENVWM